MRDDEVMPPGALLRARLAAAAAGGAILLAACASPGGLPAAGGTAAPAGEAEATTTTLPQPGETTRTTSHGALPSGPSALDDMRHPAFPDPLVDPSEIISGGPPPDGIPSIDDPAFVPVAEAGRWLADREAVVFLEIEGDARAYPVQVLMWHEIVNDTVGGVPVSVTYCPLCNSAITFRRTIRGVETTLGTSGRLHLANLVMYDRATESLWTQVGGRAVVGLLAGEELEMVSSPLVAFAEFEAAHSDGKVLDREESRAVSRRGGELVLRPLSELGRPYGSNPYGGLDDPEGSPFLFRGDFDPRLRAMRRVVALTHRDEAKAWTLEAVSGGEARVTEGEVGGDPVVIFWKEGQASALETSSVVGEREVGTLGVFLPRVEGRSLTFEARADRFVDRETGSTWNVLGEAVEGPLAGASLEKIPHFDTFWFAWSAFRPETELVEG